jgi:hypothetical protein
MQITRFVRGWRFSKDALQSSTTFSPRDVTYHNTVFLKYDTGIIEMVAAVNDMKLDSYSFTLFRLSLKYIILQHV